MPSFLDLVFTFKAPRNRPLTHALFRHENYIDENSPPLRLPHLGRSGIQIQHGFNLLTVERSDVGDRNQWPLRHASLYHSLDLETGRAVYILLKSNPELARRIKVATEKTRHLRPDTARTPGQSFIASLQVHLIMLEWSVESWSEYIDSMDEALRAQSVEAKVAPGDAKAAPLETMIIPPAVTHVESFSRNGSSFSRRGFLPHVVGNLDKRANLLQESSGIVKDPGALISQLAELEDGFSFNGLQSLSLIGDEIKRSLLALEQSKDIILQLEEQYQTVVSSYAFTTLLGQEKYKTEIAIFFRRVHSILRDMDLHHRRLRDLSSTVASYKQMVKPPYRLRSIYTGGLTVNLPLLRSLSS
jgi:hypothetical protein